MTDWAEKSEYNGDCDITRMVWNDEEDASSWEKMRGAVADSWGKTGNIENCVSLMLAGSYPIFDCGTGYGHSVKKWKPDWNAFIRSWAEVYASQADYDRADDEEEMAEMLEELGHMEVIPGETVDAFNERLWLREVEDMMDCLSEDFDALEVRLECARTMHLAATGQAA